MAITDKKTGVWGLDQTYNKINQGSIWSYAGLNQLWGAGWNNYGQMGQNNINPAPAGGVSSPIQIAGTTWSKVAATKDGALAIKTDNTLWAWGENDNGILGQNQGTTRYSSPVQIPGTWSDASSASSARVGGVKSDGTIWLWGANGHGQMAQNGPSNVNYSSPVQVPGTYDAFSVANFSPLALKTDGSLWAWGRSEMGSLGVPSIAHDAHRSSPVQIAGDWTGSKIAADYNGVAIKTDGTLWIWGPDWYGQLAQNTQGQHRSSPVQIPGTTWANIDTAFDLCIATKTDGTLWTWGRNNDGALGINQPSDEHRSSPTQLPGTNWVAVSTRGSSCSATKTDGTLWTWGMGAGGRLAANSVTYFSSPVQVPGTNWTQEMKQLSSGGGGTYFILSM